MDPVNEHDPTMDASIVHAVNVNNKKEVAEMKFLTKSLANARHVQESIYRQEEKDLIRQLWKLHHEKERRHPEIDYSARRSSHGLQSLPSDQINGSLHNVFPRGSDHRHYPHPPSQAHRQRAHDDRSWYSGHAGEISHPSTSYHHHVPTEADLHYPERVHGTSTHFTPNGASSHHFNPELFVRHHRPEYYPMPPAHRRHPTSGYQPSMEIPGLVSQSSRFNAIVQPAGYGRSIAEHAAHLGIHRHHHRGMPHYADRHPSHGHPPHPTDDIHNIQSYDSLARYINLLDYQASEESKAGRRAANRAPPHQRHEDKANEEKRGPEAPPEEVGKEKKPGRRQSMEEVIQVVENAGLLTDDEKENKGKLHSDEKATEDSVPHDEPLSTKINGAKPKSIGFIGDPLATPSPTTPATKATSAVDDTVRRRQLHPGKRQDNFGRQSHLRRKGAEGQQRSSERVDPSRRPDPKHAGDEKGTVYSVGVDKKRSSRKGLYQNTHPSRSEMLPQSSSHHQYIPRRPSVKASAHHPQPQLTHQILTDLEAIASQPGHNSRYPAPSTHHPDPALGYHQPRHPDHQSRPAPQTAAERKRLAVELLAREYPVLLRHAPTKFDPLEALMCRYLRLSSTNVETLEAMCRDAGIEVGAHAYQQIENPNEYVFGHEKL
ncbi:uncharacterized protein LOC110988477 [Acanthaster planci]|uniref:Uncharacterized protein LOC110988477 n=1 Tax=Acanthaster planci TaxID=133434 RepID=A0A8B7ZRJ4_ACAPL|nr:uncharacterized protein LOC110988477 [Acanthaster planci]